MVNNKGNITVFLSLLLISLLILGLTAVEIIWDVQRWRRRQRAQLKV